MTWPGLSNVAVDIDRAIPATIENEMSLPIDVIIGSTPLKYFLP